METKDNTQLSPEGHISKTSRRIAYSLLALYASALLLIGIVAALKDDPQVSQVWFDLFKSGFLILGGGLTTIIGYYFGSRGIQDAETRTATALKELDQARDELANQQKKVKELSDKLEDRQAPTVNEETPGIIEPPTEL